MEGRREEKTCTHADDSQHATSWSVLCSIYCLGGMQAWPHLAASNIGLYDVAPMVAELLGYSRQGDLGSLECPHHHLSAALQHQGHAV